MRSSLTPRSFSSGPRLVVILILPAGTGIKSQIGHAFANLGMAFRFCVYGQWMETVQMQHIHTPKGENETAIIVWLTKGCSVDGAASGNNLVQFHSKRLLGKRPIFGSSINPNLPPSRH